MNEVLQTLLVGVDHQDGGFMLVNSLEHSLKIVLRILKTETLCSLEEEKIVMNLNVIWNKIFDYIRTKWV